MQIFLAFHKVVKLGRADKQTNKQTNIESYNIDYRRGQDTTRGTNFKLNKNNN